MYGLLFICARNNLPPSEGGVHTSEFVQQISGNSLHGNVLLKQQSKNTVSVRQATWEIPAQKLAGMTREEYAGMTKIFSRVMATFSGDSARRLR